MPCFLLINTILVILLQVRVGKRVESVGQGGEALRRSGGLFLVSCCVIGLAAGLPAWAAMLLLVSAVVVHTLGELSYAASFAMDFGLAPAHAQGQYQGLVGIGFSSGAAIAPVLMIAAGPQPG